MVSEIAGCNLACGRQLHIAFRVWRVVSTGFRLTVKDAERMRKRRFVGCGAPRGAGRVLGASWIVIAALLITAVALLVPANASAQAPNFRVLAALISSTPLRGDTYGNGETIELRVTLSRVPSAVRPVSVYFGFHDPGTSEDITFHGRATEESRGNANVLIYRYTVVSTDRDDDGLSVIRATAPIPRQQSEANYAQG